MPLPQESVNMALFCDFENVALGVRDANYEKFDIKKVLERLLLKGNILVKKAYCDWSRYQGFKATMHEASFELIDIPHVRQSGKNSADIRLVVDALDLCYTKTHVDTFVIISGDSDFSPLVSKLRENAKQVIGVGVKQSTSDLLIGNCDEFIFYDDLVRESQRQARREARPTQAQGGRRGDDEGKKRDEVEVRRSKAIDLAVETYEALAAERGDGGKIWASVLKEAIKRRRPDFNESYFGFKAFGNLLEAAQQRGLLQFGRDDKSGAYVYRQNGRADVDDELGDEFDMPVAEVATPAAARPAAAGREGKDARDGREGRDARDGRDGKEARDGKDGRERRQGQGRRRDGGRDARAEAGTPVAEPSASGSTSQDLFAQPAEPPAVSEPIVESRTAGAPAPGEASDAAETPVSTQPAADAAAPAPEQPAAKRARKQPARVAKTRAKAAQQQVVDAGQPASAAQAAPELPLAPVADKAGKADKTDKAKKTDKTGAAATVTPAPSAEAPAESGAPAAEAPAPARKASTRRAPRKRAAATRPEGE